MRRARCWYARCTVTSQEVLVHRIAAALAIGLSIVATASSARAQLVKVASFGSNPGALDMYEYVPKDLPAGRPLVVVMHGCTQTANDMLAAGWNELADAYKFAVVYPQQRSANNPVTCFNWAGEYGDPANMVRGQGENQSVIQMVDTEIATHGADRAHVYIAGFSAGAAFVSVMLATWPDRFAAGSIMSGVPYRCATSVQGAYNCQQMNLHTELEHAPKEWGDLVRAADSGFAGPWPRVQIWHGSADGTVAPQNATELVKQWTDVHGADQTADATETIGKVTRTEYHAGASVVVEEFIVSQMNHAISIGAADPQHPCGKAGSYFSDSGMCSTWRAAMFFGLVGGGGGGGGGGGDMQPPTVDVLQPSSGGTVGGTVTIVVAASDDVAIDHVTVTIDGAELGSSGTAPYQLAWDTTIDGDGAHAIAAIAYDKAGHTATDDDTHVTVTNGGGGGGPGRPDGGGNPGNGGGGAGDLPGCSCGAAGGLAPGGWLMIAIVALGLALRSAPRSRRRRARA
jgi:poly(hydroxyalkanoate) depolymerase family esterase